MTARATVDGAEKVYDESTGRWMAEQWPECVKRWRELCAAGKADCVESTLRGYGYSSGSPAYVAALGVLRLLATTQPPEPAALCGSAEVVEAVRAWQLRESEHDNNPGDGEYNRARGAERGALLLLRTATLRTEDAVREEEQKRCLQKCADARAGDYDGAWREACDCCAELIGGDDGHH